MQKFLLSGLWLSVKVRVTDTGIKMEKSIGFNHYLQFEQNHFTTVPKHVNMNSKSFSMQSLQRKFFPQHQNLTLKLYQNVQFELSQHKTKFQPDHRLEISIRLAGC